MNPQVKRRKMEKPPPTVIGRTNDVFCWVCHRENVGLCCIACPRAYHLRCASEREVSVDWVCPECIKILNAENVDTRSPSLSDISLDKLSKLLKISLQRLKYKAHTGFHFPVPLDFYPAYPNYVIHPMDMSLVEKNVKQKLYGCTEAFLADFKWMLHNSCVFNGPQHNLSSNARALVKKCDADMQEIEVCPDCFMHTSNAQEKYWFSEVCSKPHPIVWAKLTGFPYWPAKVVQVKNNEVDARFFGAHDRAWVGVNQCYHLSKEVPTVHRPKKKGNYESALDELNVHVQILIQKFGIFEYAPYRTPFNPENKYYAYHGIDVDCLAKNIKPFENSSEAEDAKFLDNNVSIFLGSDLDAKMKGKTAESDAKKDAFDNHSEEDIQTDSKALPTGVFEASTQAEAQPEVKKSSPQPKDVDQHKKFESVLERIKGYVSISDDKSDSEMEVDEAVVPPKPENIPSSQNKLDVLPTLPCEDVPDPAPVIDLEPKNDSFRLKLTETIESCKAKLGISEVAEDESSDSESGEEEGSSEEEESNASSEEEESEATEDTDVEDPSLVICEENGLEEAAVSPQPEEKKPKVEDDDIYICDSPLQKPATPPLIVLDDSPESPDPEPPTPPPRRPSRQFPEQARLARRTISTAKRPINKIPPVEVPDNSPKDNETPTTNGPHTSNENIVPNVEEKDVTTKPDSICESPIDVGEEDEEKKMLRDKVSLLTKAFQLQHWKHTQEMNELRHNMDLVIMEMRASLDADKKQHVEAVVKKLESEKLACLNKVKRMQWCANCLEESRYSCCWNTSYCTPNCQRAHFPDHSKWCQQVQKQVQDQKKFIVLKSTEKAQLQYVLAPKPPTTEPSAILKTKDLDGSEIISNVRNGKCNLGTAITLLTEKNIEVAEAIKATEPPEEANLEDIYFPIPKVNIEGLDTLELSEDDPESEINLTDDQEEPMPPIQEEKSSNNELDNELVSIGPDVKIKAKFLNKCLIYGTTAKRLTRSLVDVIFPDTKLLATCSTLGNKSNVTKLTRNPLPPNKVQSIIDYVQRRFPEAMRSEIVLAINMKCKEARYVMLRSQGPKYKTKRQLLKRMLDKEEETQPAPNVMCVKAPNGSTKTAQFVMMPKTAARSQILIKPKPTSNPVKPPPKFSPTMLGDGKITFPVQMPCSPVIFVSNMPPQVPRPIASNAVKKMSPPTK